MLRHGLLAVFLAVNVCGCSMLSNMFEPDPVRPLLDLPPPTPVKLENIKFKVLTKENAQEYFLILESKNQQPVVIALSAADYKNLSVNMQKLKAFIKEQQKIIKLYKEYYEGNDGASK